MRNSHAIRESVPDRIFLTVVYVFLILVLLVVLYPLIFIVSSSFSSTTAVISGQVWLFPVEPTLLGYKAVFNNKQIWIGFYNSFFYSTVGTLVNVTLTVMMGYALSRKSFYGRQLMMMILVFTMLFSGGLIPTYLTVKNLGLIDTRWALIIPQAMAVWQVIIARTFFQSSIPDELAEASELDGCSDFAFMLKVVLPLSKPIIAVLFLMYAVGHWNSYFDGLLYLSSASKFPLQIYLRNILIMNTVDATMMSNIKTFSDRQGLQNLLKYSLIVISSLPVLVIFPLVQKHFVKGVMVGSLKG